MKQEVVGQNFPRDRFVPPVPELCIEALDEIAIGYLHPSLPFAVPAKIVRLANASVKSPPGPHWVNSGHQQS